MAYFYTPELYEELAKAWPPEETFSRNVGGTNLTYVTGEQVTTRLNKVLGVDGWSFRSLEHGLNAEADEIWVLGELTAFFLNSDGSLYDVVRQQFGSQKIKRSRQSGQPLDVGFDLKGATTDAMKKCASMIGVGLYLSERTPNQGGQDSFAPPPAVRPQQQFQQGTTQSQQPPPPVHQHQASDEDGAPLWCSKCQTEIQPVYFNSGDIWSPQRMAQQSNKKHGRTLCMQCYRDANNQVPQEQYAGAPNFGALAGRE